MNSANSANCVYSDYTELHAHLHNSSPDDRVTACR